MSYESAPATELLATACACCGRALVDAESVEVGIGPECRKKFAIDNVADSAAREAANAFVHAVARKGVSKAACREVCAKLEALGYPTLAMRVLKRFRLRPLPPTAPVDVEALRVEYKKILADFTYDNVTAPEFNALVKASGASTPAEFVAAAKSATCTCRRCAGTGRFITGSVNGKPTGPGGDCFRCEGRGYQTLEDARRNRAFDAYNLARHAG